VIKKTDRVKGGKRNHRGEGLRGGMREKNQDRKEEKEEKSGEKKI